MSAARPLDQYPLVRARDVEDAREAFAEVYANNLTLEPLERSGMIDVVINNLKLSDIGLNYTGYGASVRVQFSNSEFITLSFPIRGQGRIPINGTERLLDHQCGLVTPAETAFASRLCANYEHVVLRLNPQALQAKLAAMLGSPVDGSLQFDPLLNFSSVNGRLLRDQFFFLVDLVSRSAASLPALVQAEIEQAIMVMFLHATGHKYSHLLNAEVAAAPAEVRRAEDYIAANWQQPITLEDLAAVTGVSAFSLFRSFVKFRGYSPMQFVEKIRAKKQDLS